jgi:hypothetical protein
MDDDHNDKGKKTNASPEHKPQNASQKDVAPPGSVGRAPAGPPTPGLGSKGLGQALDQSTNQKIDFRKNLDQAPAKDDRPVAIETDDKAVNQDSEAKGFQLKTETEIKELGHPNKDKGTDAPERSGDQFKETSDPDVNAFYQQTDDMVSREDAVQQRAEKIAAKFSQDKSKDHDLGH